MSCDPALLRQLLSESGARFTQTAVSYVFDCPLCSGRKKLYIRKRDGRFVCWKCKDTERFQGRAEYALTEILGLPVRVIQDRIYHGGRGAVKIYLDVSPEDFFEDPEDEDAPQSLNELFWPLDYYPIDHKASVKAAAYLEGRGIPLEVASKYHLHYAPTKSRVVFPIEAQGRLYGYQERLIVDNHWVDDDGVVREEPKILSSSGIPRDRMVMFADRLENAEHAVLTEGPVDGIKADWCNGNVCAMGKAVSTAQFRLLLNAGVKKIYLALDPDAADEVQRLIRTYYDDVELYTMFATSHGGPEKADLGAMSFQEVHDLWKNAPKVRPWALFSYLKPFAG